MRDAPSICGADIPVDVMPLMVGAGVADDKEIAAPGRGIAVEFDEHTREVMPAETVARNAWARGMGKFLRYLLAAHCSSSNELEHSILREASSQLSNSTAIAIDRIARDEHTHDFAINQFLGRHRRLIASVARQSAGRCAASNSSRSRSTSSATVGTSSIKAVECPPDQMSRQALTPAGIFGR